MQIIIVIGNDNTEIMKKRLDIAIKEFKSSQIRRYSYVSNNYIPCKKFLLTGGSLDENGISNAEKMKQYAISQGVDPSVIIVDDKSKNTVESIINSEKIIRKSFSGCEVYTPHIVICTSSFHMTRVLFISKIYFGKYKVSFIHTNETVTKEEKMYENHAILRFIESYTASSAKLNFE